MKEQGSLSSSAPTSPKGWAAPGAKPGGKVGVTGVNPDPGRPTSESWYRFPVWVAQAVNVAQHDHPRRGWEIVETVYGPHHTLEQVVTASSGDCHSDNQISHTRSILDSYVEARGC